jgi:hypothetical protein
LPAAVWYGDEKRPTTSVTAARSASVNAWRSPAVVNRMSEAIDNVASR